MLRLSVMDEKGAARLFGELTQAYGELAHDAIAAAKESNANPAAQSHRRTYVFKSFATIELATYLAKHTLITLAGIGEIQLSAAELALLKEESYKLASNGKARIEGAKLNTLANFKFALNIFYEKLAPEKKVDFSGLGWQAFQSALSIRNRITHPKCLSDIRIRDEEIETINRAVEFVTGTQTGVHRVLLKYAEKIRPWLE